MKTNQLWLKRMMKLGLLLMMGVGMNTNAGLFGFGGTNWKEDVLLHDGQKWRADNFLGIAGYRRNAHD